MDTFVLILGLLYLKLSIFVAYKILKKYLKTGFIFEFFIAHRFVTPNNAKHNISRSIIKISIVAISLGLAVMITAVAIVTGFKIEIRNKVIGFSSHINIVNHDTNSSYESQPIFKNQSFYPYIDTIQGIKHIQTFATKYGIIKTQTDIQGVVLKGVGSEYDWSFFNNYIVEGKPFTVVDTTKTNEVIISRYLANLLKLKVNDDLFMYFIQKPPRGRKFQICGIYDTGLEEYDKFFILADISHIQKLNNWADNQVSGFEIFIDNWDDLDPATALVEQLAGFKFLDDGSRLKVQNIKQLSPQMFDWLQLTDMNVQVILILMIIVAAINMVSGLLVLILERTRMIGILKALGTTDWSIQQIFLYNSIFLIAKGLFWGNLIGFAVCLIQKHFAIIRLDPASYYVSSVPINFDFFYIAALNVGTMLIILTVLIIPSYLITKISPLKAIQFN